MGKTNRLFTVLNTFFSQNEFPHKADGSNLEIHVGIPNQGRTVHAQWKVSSSGNSYQWGVNLGRVQRSHESRLATKIMKSEPIIGVTERISKGNVIAVGDRDNQSKLSNTQIRQNVMDDIARIAKVDNQIRPHMNNKSRR